MPALLTASGIVLTMLKVVPFVIYKLCRVNDDFDTWFLHKQDEFIAVAGALVGVVAFPDISIVDFGVSFAIPVAISFLKGVSGAIGGLAISHFYKKKFKDK